MSSLGAVLLDSEGFRGLEADSQYETHKFSLATLLCSTLVYNRRASHTLSTRLGEVLLDMEGIWGLEADSQYNARILLLATLLCSTLVFNKRGLTHPSL
jgi:hypothetical protein